MTGQRTPAEIEDAIATRTDEYATARAALGGYAGPLAEKEALAKAFLRDLRRLEQEFRLAQETR